MSSRWRFTLALTVLVAIHLATLFGGFLAPNSPILQNRELPWSPPSKLRFVDAEGRFHLRPFVYPLVADEEEIDVYREDQSRIYPLRFFVRGDPYRLAGLVPVDIHFLGLDAPGRLYFLGTDSAGRDVFARTLVGGRLSLLAGLLAAILALAIGLVVGGIAGYVGGRTDTTLMRLVELFLSLPWLYCLLALRAFLPLTLPPPAAFLLLVSAVSLLGWALPARLIRSATLSAKTRLFVHAARGLGAKHPHLFWRHVLPQAIPLILTQAAILVPSFVLAEITLSFFGLSLSPSQPTWGTLFVDLKNYHVLANRHWMLATPAPLLLLFFAFYSIREAQTLHPHFN